MPFHYSVAMPVQPESRTQVGASRMMVQRSRAGGDQPHWAVRTHSVLSTDPPIPLGDALPVGQRVLECLKTYGELVYNHTDTSCSVLKYCLRRLAACAASRLPIACVITPENSHDPTASARRLRENAPQLPSVLRTHHRSTLFHLLFKQSATAMLSRARCCQDLAVRAHVCVFYRLLKVLLGVS